MSGAGTSYQRADSDGTVVIVGQFVKVLGLTGDWLDSLPSDEKADVKSMIGNVFPIDEIDDFGQPWVCKIWLDQLGSMCRSHSIALEPYEMELVADDSQSI